MTKASFSDLFCEKYQCTPEAFCEKALWHCLYPQAMLPARFIWSLNRAYFQPDIELIEKVGNLSKPAEVRLELKRFRYYHRPKGLSRRFLKVRLSGQRLLDLADELFARPA